MIGKFKTPEALWQSYQQLEKAFTQKCQQIKRMEEQNMKVYEVKIDWATNDAEDCTTEVYSTEEKARKAFNFEIAQAMQDYGVFDEETGELIDEGWKLDMGNTFWELWEDGYYTSNHCLITLTEKEVK
jgi:hypothetical protein